MKKLVAKLRRDGTIQLNAHGGLLLRDALSVGLAILEYGVKLEGITTDELFWTKNAMERICAEVRAEIDRRTGGKF